VGVSVDWLRAPVVKIPLAMYKTGKRMPRGAELASSR
jgi:hypothetical protein